MPLEIFSAISVGFPEFIISAFIISNSLSTILLSIFSFVIANGFEAAICIAIFPPTSSFLPFVIPSNFTTEIILPIPLSIAECT